MALALVAGCRPLLVRQPAPPLPPAPPAAVAPAPPPPAADSGEILAFINLAYRAAPGAHRALGVRIDHVANAARVAPEPVTWRVTIERAEPLRAPDGGAAIDEPEAPAPLGEGAPAAAALREWTGHALFADNRVKVRIAWDGLDAEGAPLGEGRYVAHLSARSGEASVLAEHGFVVGAPAPPVVKSGAAPPVVERLPVGVPAPGGLPYAVVLGNLHSQSNHSDGGGDPATCTHAEVPQGGAVGPEAAFDIARTRAHLDFLLLSEHNHMYDGDPNSVRASASPSAIRSTFEGGLALAARYREQHAGFVALYGTEYGVIAGGGHLNLINPTGLVTWEESGGGELLGHFRVGRSDYHALYALMRSQGWIGQFNHPDPGQFAIAGEPMAWDADGDEVMALAEIGNSPAFSSALDESDKDFSSFERGYNKLLLRGYHVAPASNQDNHCANWGLSAPNRTGFLIPNGTALSADAILAAARARRTFATTDKTARVALVANGHLMGERFESAGPIALEVLYASDGAEAIDAIDIVRGKAGGARVTTIASPRASLPLTLPPGEWFLYARVRQHDGDLLWSAPVWITQRPVAPAN